MWTFTLVLFCRIYILDVVRKVCGGEVFCLLCTDFLGQLVDYGVYMQPSFTPAPASNAQPTMRTTFVPSTPPALKNADQYQQPTMSSHSFTVCELLPPV